MSFISRVGALRMCAGGISDPVSRALRQAAFCALYAAFDLGAVAR
jgi:hypothetical protein